MRSCDRPNTSFTITVHVAPLLRAQALQKIRDHHLGLLSVMGIALAKRVS
jgi:hypothetical protein